jgi:hypothetical protein
MIKNKRKMRRKIPVFRVSIEPGADYSQLNDVPEIKQIVLEETIFAIKDGIKKNKNSISLFEVAHTDYYIELSKNKWKPSLEKALEYFLEKEEYDRCAVMRDLISKL